MHRFKIMGFDFVLLLYLRSDIHSHDIKHGRKAFRHKSNNNKCTKVEANLSKMGEKLTNNAK